MKTNKKEMLFGAFALMLGAGFCGLATSMKTTDVAAAAKTMDQIEFSMVDGASMRITDSLDASSTGLRFALQVPKSDYEAIDTTIYTDVEWGVLIAPVDSVEKADFTVDNLFGDNAKYVFNRELTSEDEGKYAAINVTETALTLASETSFGLENPDSIYVFAGYMHTIKDENLTRGFVGRGYVKYTENGTVKYRLADYAEGDKENNSRSAYYVGAKYVEANSGDEDKGAQSDYVKENYLSKVDSQDKQLVTVAVSDYYEDLTIGSYKSTADEVVNKTVAIGSKLTAKNLSEEKEGYTLRSDLSSLSDFEPTYARTDLKATRKYESKEYIPFSETEGEVTKVTEGDFAGAYKFEGKGINLYFSNPNNNKIIRNVTVPEDGNVHIVNYVTMKVYCTAYGSFNFVSKMGKYVVGSPAWCVSMDWYDSAAIGTNSERTMNESSVAYYKEDGSRTFMVQTNTWYTVSFPIRTNYSSSERDGKVYWELHSDNTLYFKDVQIANKAEDPMEVNGYSAYDLKTNGTTTKTTEVSEGDFAGMKKVDTFNSSNWNIGVYFVGDAMEGLKANKTFFEEGARYVTFDVYFTGATTSVQFFDNLGKQDDTTPINKTVSIGESIPSFAYTYTCNSDNKWGKWNVWNTVKSGTTKTIETFRFYDAQGNKAETLEKDTWYSVVVTTMTNISGWWGNVKIAPFGGSEKAPATMYYGNLRYSYNNPKA